MQKFFKKISEFTKSFRENLKALQEHKQWRYTPQFAMGLVIVITVTLIFPSSQSYQFANLKEGDVYTREEIIAPFTFFVNKTAEEIANDRQSAIEKVPLVFDRVDSVELKHIGRFDEFFKEISAIRNAGSTDLTATAGEWGCDIFSSRRLVMRGYGSSMAATLGARWRLARGAAAARSDSRTDRPRTTRTCGSGS